MLIVDFEPIQGHEQGGSCRALVVSYEPIHAMGMMTVCPVTAAHTQPRNPLEIAIRAGEAGQTRDGLILVHQVRTVSLLRAGEMLRRGAAVHRLIDPQLREQVRRALAIQLGLDIPGTEDGAVSDDRYGGVEAS
jgi:mRNA-degrading endonuclease toxin of MazEF toxin-antitoxin module